MEADPATAVAVYDSYNNGTADPWTGIGGTSLATPMWAGLIAIANQGRVSEGGTTLNSSSDPTQTLSALYSLPTDRFPQHHHGQQWRLQCRARLQRSHRPGLPDRKFAGPRPGRLRDGEAARRHGPAPAHSSRLGQPFDLQISAEDSYGHVDHSYDGAVTLSGLALNGSPVTASAIDGVATFNGVSVNAGGDLARHERQLERATTNVINTDGTTPVGFTPQQIRTAYGDQQHHLRGHPGNGPGQTIAIIDFYD